MSQFPDPAWFHQNAYFHAKQMPDGSYMAVTKMLYTAGIVVGITEHGYRSRYCYEHFVEAVAALASWDG